MPTRIPRNTTIVVIRNRGTIRIIYNMDLVGHGVRLTGDMDVIVVRRILIAKEQAQIAVRVLVHCGIQLKLHHKAAYDDILDQIDVGRRCVWRRVVALPCKRQNISITHLFNLPDIRVCCLPGIQTIGFEIVLECQDYLDTIAVNSLGKYLQAFKRC